MSGLDDIDLGPLDHQIETRARALRAMAGLARDSDEPSPTWADVADWYDHWAGVLDGLAAEARELAKRPAR